VALAWVAVRHIDAQLEAMRQAYREVRIDLGDLVSTEALSEIQSDLEAEGLRLRATGLNANAARWAGVDVTAQIGRAMALSGGFAGMAGGIELLGVTHRLFERFASGYGYSGIAVALLAQLHPLATIASALFFGALTTGAGELQRAANVAASVATLGQAVVILALILLDSRRRP